MAPPIKTVSKQAGTVYRLINSNESLSIQEIAEKLDILPNGIYRATNKLENLGLIERVGGYPVRYRAVPAATAISMYLTATALSLREGLAINPKHVKKENRPMISFIKDREASLKKTGADALLAKESIDYIVSGYEVPDETYISFRKAAISGVRIRTIVQSKSEIAGGKLEKWQDIGAQVRYLPNLGLRLFIYDRQVIYIASYDKNNPSSMFGVRFKYAPLAEQMTELFEQNWQKAKEL